MSQPTSRRQWREARIRALITRDEGPFAWRYFQHTLPLRQHELEAVLSKHNVSPQQKVEALFTVMTTLINEHPDDPVVKLILEDLADELGIILTPPPHTPSTAAAAADDDMRSGDGWQEAVGREGVRIPYGDEYLYSTHWQLLRNLWRTGRCSNCKRDGRTDLHHRTYVRVGRERPTDVEELCRECHQFRHGGGQRKAA